jgi:hypothetical protein
MLTGSLPFAAADPMEWVHCHIARNPVPPSERVANVPTPVSALIMKLLAKTAEERYQTAGGVERDLLRCLTEWKARRRIEDFPLGGHDTPDRLLIPEKLYGREREVETLLTAFDRIVTSGMPELVLVSGYAGIGKSAVVNELHRALVPPRGLVAAGKFDQYKRDIPYATLAQAFQSLVRPLLGKSDAELAGWRDAILNALGPNGRLMVDVVPELKFVIGEQPPIPELSPQAAQRRFQLVFQRFIGVFARAEHPLALFLDDLQWLDAATLDLLEALLTGSELQHLMLIGAYRDNEVTAAHPLMRKLEATKAAGAKVSEIVLAPLAEAHFGRLIADALRCEPARAAPLAQLVHEKTGGNPFFTIQFLSSLVDTAMLAFHHDTACWLWDLERIHAKGYTDNVADLMVAKLNRLPAETQNALQELACLGNFAETTTIASHDCAAGSEWQHLDAVTADHKQLQLWAANCPAIRSARENGFMHNEALANELAARFYAGHGFETISLAYLRNARYCYVRRGADGKVRQLDQSYPHFKDEPLVAGPTNTIGTPVEQLNLAIVIKVSQAVSGEIVLEKLIDMLMRTAMAQAGAWAKHVAAYAWGSAADRGGGHNPWRRSRRAST